MAFLMIPRANWFYYLRVLNGLPGISKRHRNDEPLPQEESIKWSMLLQYMQIIDMIMGIIVR